MKGFLITGTLVRQFAPEVQAFVLADEVAMAVLEFDRRMKAYYNCSSQITTVSDAIAVFDVKYAYKMEDATWTQ